MLPQGGGEERGGGGEGEGEEEGGGGKGRRWIYTEEKAKVVAAVWGTFLNAAQAI